MGTSLARKLDRQGYEVCAIDQDPERLKALGPTFGGQTVAGVGFDREVLAAAGIDRASAVIACTASDETNIVVAASPDRPIASRASSRACTRSAMPRRTAGSASRASRPPTGA